jgi:hypothetical protein
VAAVSIPTVHRRNSETAILAMDGEPQSRWSAAHTTRRDFGHRTADDYPSEIGERLGRA